MGTGFRGGVTSRWGMSVLCAIVVAAMLGGCGAAPKVEKPLAEGQGGNVVEARMAFWHKLPERPMISNNTAFHAVLLFFEGKDAASDYGERVAMLKERGMLPDGFDAPAGAAVERGNLAVALVKGLEIKGGLMMRLLGPTPRYATRELEYLGFYPEGSPQQAISGEQLMGLIAQAEDFQRMNASERAARVRSVQRSSAFGADGSRMADQGEE